MQKKLLKHQMQMLQAPYLFPEISKFFVVAGYGCVTENTKILTPSGWIEISKFNGGDVYSYNESTKEIEKDISSKPFKRGNGCFFKIRLQNGKEIECSLDHKILTSFGWQEISSLLSQDFYTKFSKSNTEVNLLVNNNIQVYTTPVSSTQNLHEIPLSSISLDVSYIESIQYIGNHIKYDVTVASNHNYITDGFINHNCGKTSGQVDCILYAVQQLQGKYDREGRNPKIGLFGVSITFLEKTLLMNLDQTLKNSMSSYKWDRKKNSITIGNVEILIVSMEEPGKIFGFDVCCSFLDELDELPSNVSIEAFKSVNERTRQHIEGFRSPFILTTTTAQGIKGTYQVCKTLEKSGLGELIIRARTRDNIYLPKDYVNGLYSLYNEKEIKCLLEGEFLSIDSGLVFPDYNPEKNKLNVDLYDSIGPDDTVYIAQDFNCIGKWVTINTNRGGVMMAYLREGDYVLTRKGYKRVIHKVFLGTQKCLALLFSNKKKIICTPDHRFIDADNNEVFAKDIKPDTVLLGKNGEHIFLVHKDTKKIKQDVYDIEVEDEHEFFANGILVHNCGFNNAVAFVVLENSIIAIRDYELPDMRKAPEVFRMDFPSQKIVWIPDMTYKEHFGEFKKELHRCQIQIAYRACNPRINDRIFACNKLFHIERLFVCPVCKDLELALITHQRDVKTGEPMKGGKGAPDHKSDCLGYAVHYLLCWNPSLKDVYDLTLARLYDKRRDNVYSNNEEDLEIKTKLIGASDIKEKEKFGNDEL